MNNVNKKYVGLMCTRIMASKFIYKNVDLLLRHCSLRFLLLYGNLSGTSGVVIITDYGFTCEVTVLIYNRLGYLD